LEDDISILRDLPLQAKRALGFWAWIALQIPQESRTKETQGNPWTSFLFC
jgi:hypothetical protein